MGGYDVSAQYSECIASGADFAKLTLAFDLKYPVDVPYSRTVTYSFKIEAIPNEKYKEDTDTGFSDSAYPKKVRVFDEVISVSGLFDGEIQNKQPIMITPLEEYPIGSVRKHQEYVGENKDEAVVDLAVNQRTAKLRSRSLPKSLSKKQGNIDSGFNLVNLYNKRLSCYDISWNDVQINEMKNKSGGNDHNV